MLCVRIGAKHFASCLLRLCYNTERDLLVLIKIKMEFTAGLRKTRKNPRKIVTDSLSELYPHDLQMYNVPPGNEITLSEFEDLAIERLQLLRILEQTTLKGHKLYSADWTNTVKADLRKAGLTKFLNLLEPSRDDLQARRADHISHFILRLAYCRSEDLRRWFLAREQEWFRIRFRELKPEGVKAFLDLNNLVYKAISLDEKRDVRSQLYESTVGIHDVDTTSFYKVPFTEVYSLLKHRRVYMHAGFAYIPDFELITCILSVFRAHLSEALAYASRKIPLLDDDRLNLLLTNLHSSYTGRDYAPQENKETIDIQLLDQYSRKHFPLCMRHIHETFRATHHMKYGCRLQYGLFIKGIGVSFDDAMTFWREEFTKLIDGSLFEKKYSYAVKHQFGKAGSMVNYSPYSCMKIISESVGSGEHHGCPFRHFDATNLQQKMNEHGISKKGIDEIMELVKNMHFQLACTKYFEHSHGQPNKNAINHPNQYFEESRALVADGAKGGSSAKKPRPSLVTVNPEEIWGEEMEH